VTGNQTSHNLQNLDASFSGCRVELPHNEPPYAVFCTNIATIRKQGLKRAGFIFTLGLVLAITRPATVYLRRGEFPCRSGFRLLQFTNNGGEREMNGWPPARSIMWTDKLAGYRSIPAPFQDIFLLNSNVPQAAISAVFAEFFPDKLVLRQPCLQRHEDGYHRRADDTANRERSRPSGDDAAEGRLDAMASAFFGGNMAPWANYKPDWQKKDFGMEAFYGENGALIRQSLKALDASPKAI
jgi:hypothetical protein